ncbi:hypothetical protein M427DRAFT_60834 [Gonapodya prolifera JEL478]|uniref:Uncharacterized protein n=1 Tax=Gonapodya prolifera (strain JEL478) TaxID=1344416 RepID=A0A139A380_GONPJ|nr:hypothetical protein M427DRAFT_60834 [Gonapodya prolifera JEL478]|eukprot:KXS11267.1 hypothetical protein M427DRAFT_60834 [Gonapodya prolifera JEL478]
MNEFSLVSDPNASLRPILQPRSLLHRGLTPAHPGPNELRSAQPADSFIPSSSHNHYTQNLLILGKRSTTTHPLRHAVVDSLRGPKKLSLDESGADSPGAMDIDGATPKTAQAPSARDTKVKGRAEKTKSLGSAATPPPPLGGTAMDVDRQEKKKKKNGGRRRYKKSTELDLEMFGDDEVEPAGMD